MTEPKRREGLEGLPVDSDEVVMMDGARYLRSSDRAALVTVWFLAIGAAALAFLGGSIGLGVVALVGLVVAIYWTVGSVRSARSQ